MKTSKLIAVISGIGLLFSCNENEPTEKLKTQQVTEIDSMYESADEDFVLPPFLSIAKSFKNAGLVYAKGKTNPVENSKNYELKIKRLLNMGIYSTDLAYCSLNDKNQEAREYLKVIQELANEVGLGSVFQDQALLDRFDQSLEKREDLEGFIYDLQERSEMYLQDNELRHIATVQFAGAWIEGMYLGVGNAVKYPNEKVTGVLTDQMYLVKNMIRGLESYPDPTPELKEIIAGLTKILTTYEAFESVKNKPKNPNLKAVLISQEELKVLLTEVVKVRTNIVSIN
jgi:hypothetical protein